MLFNPLAYNNSTPLCSYLLVNMGIVPQAWANRGAIGRSILCLQPQANEGW